MTVKKYLNLVTIFFVYGVTLLSLTGCQENKFYSNIKPNRPPDITWVKINDSGAGMKDEDGNPISYEGFVGQMSKYETTNEQYCQFLNDAIKTEDIIVDGNNVKGSSGLNSGADFVGYGYYRLEGPAGNIYDDPTTNCCRAPSIKYNGSSFTVDSGLENHPVTYVSWYGATAFCNYYRWRLPTAWEWQAVADYDGSYIYGCGTTINNNIANVQDSNHPDGTTPVGAFGSYGYGMADMTGNAWEWTSSPSSAGSRVIQGGGWKDEGVYCTVSSSYWHGIYLNDFICYLGFRVCHCKSDSIVDIINATSEGNLEQVRKLLKKGANVNSQDKDGITALWWAVYGGHIEIVKALLEAKPDVNIQDKYGQTALIEAASEGYTEIVKALLEAKPDVNIQDKFSQTALILAARKGYADIAKALLVAKADVDINSGSALWSAINCEHTDVVNVLLEAKANVNIQNGNGITALELAAQEGNIDIVKGLLKAGANVNIQDKMLDETPLMAAAQKGYLDVVKALLNAKADVNIQEKDFGKTALWMAASSGYTEIVKVLLEAKADVNLKASSMGDTKYTSLSIAKICGYTEIVKLLKEHGAKD